MASEPELLTCYNKGCGQKFKADDNSESSCQYHPGGPIFHEGYKGWSCCKKRTTDFTEFLNMKGCTQGRHSNVKPPEPAKEKQEKPKVEEMIQLEVTPNHRQPNPTRQEERPPENEELTPLKVVVTTSLKSQLEKLSLNDKVEDDSSPNGEVIKIGSCCHNKGCKALYEGEHSNLDTCYFHPGVPVFHEGVKYWSCCVKRTSDFQAFLNQAGCEAGKHNWIKPKESEEKLVRTDWFQTTSTVSLSIFAKVAMPEKTIIKANRVLCQVDIVYEGGKSKFSKTYILTEAIDPSKSDVKLMGTKVEINLKKASSFSWPTLELPAESS